PKANVPIRIGISAGSYSRNATAGKIGKWIRYTNTTDIATIAPIFTSFAVRLPVDTAAFVSVLILCLSFFSRTRGLFILKKAVFPEIRPPDQKRNPGNNSGVKNIDQNEPPPALQEADRSKSLLSSRLYCRYRNSFLKESHRFGRSGERFADCTAGWDLHPTPKICSFLQIII